MQMGNKAPLKEIRVITKLPNSEQGNNKITELRAILQRESQHS